MSYISRVGKTWKVTNLDDGARKLVIEHLRGFADRLEKGAQVHSGGIMLKYDKGNVSLKSDIIIKPSE